MRRIRLGKTNLKVSQVGFGGIPITRPSDYEANDTIQRAIELGVNFFDTATGYGMGESEIRIGKAIAEYRSKVVVATKSATITAEKTLDRIKESLRLLDTDYIDLFQLGNVTKRSRYDRILKTGGGVQGIKQAIGEGLVNHIGLSTHDLSIAKDAVTSGEFETVQVIINALAQEATEDLLDLAKENDVGIIAMKPFGAGMIKDPLLAINYLLQYENVVINPGIETREEIEEIVDIANNFQFLSEELRDEIHELHSQLTARFCRHCDMCMPCPNEVNISSVIYLQAAWHLRSFEWFLKGAKSNVESYSGCTDCGECESKCSFGIPVRELMKESIKLYNEIQSKPS